MSQASGKHAPCRLDTYLTVHENVMDRFKRSGFVGDDTLSVDDFSQAGFYFMQGEIACLGNIVITVYKIIDIVASGDVPMVRTSRYSYNVRVMGQHNLFRYDNWHAHRGHPDEHQKTCLILLPGIELIPNGLARRDGLPWERLSRKPARGGPTIGTS